MLREALSIIRDSKDKGAEPALRQLLAQLEPDDSLYFDVENTLREIGAAVPRARPAPPRAHEDESEAEPGPVNEPELRKRVRSAFIDLVPGASSRQGLDAIRCLSRNPTPENIELLALALDSLASVPGWVSVEARKEIVRAFADIPDPAIRRLLESASQNITDDFLIVPFARALALQGSGMAEHLFEDAMRDTELREKAIEGLLGLDRPLGARLLWKALTCKDGGGRKDLAEVLENGSGPQSLVGRLTDYARSRDCPPEEGRRILEYVEALSECPRLGITLPFRFSPDVLTEVVRNRLQEERGEAHLDKRPVAALVLAREDHNGAFYMDSDTYRSLVRAGYRVVVYEAGSDQDVIDRLTALADHGGADLLVLGAHGSRSAMGFGSGDPMQGIAADDGTLDLGDVQRLRQARVGRALKDGGTMVMVSCSVGIGGAAEQNMANMMRELFPHAAVGSIFSPRAVTAFEGFEFDETGRVKGARFTAGTYHAGSHAAPGRRRAA